MLEAIDFEGVDLMDCVSTQNLAASGVFVAPPRKPFCRLCGHSRAALSNLPVKPLVPARNPRRLAGAGRLVGALDTG
jgi:hypothetical protein